MQHDAPEKLIKAVYIMHHRYTDGMMCHIRVVHDDDSEFMRVLTHRMTNKLYPAANPKVHYLTKVIRK